MVLSSPTRAKSSGDHRGPGFPVEEEVLNLSTEAHNRLYMTPTGGIGNVNEPESNNLHRYPLTRGKVLKLPWKRQKGGASKGSFFASPPASEPSISDCTTSQSNPEARSQEHHSPVSPTEQPPRIYDAVSSWNVRAPTESNSRPPAQTVSLVPAPSLRSHQSLDIIPTICTTEPPHSHAINAPSCTSLGSSPVRRVFHHPLASPAFGLIYSPCEPTAVGHGGEITSSKSVCDYPREPKLQPNFLSQPSSPREASIDRGILPENSSNHARFAQHMENVKTAEATVIQTLMPPPSHLRQSRPSLTSEGSSYSRAKSIDISSLRKGAGGLRRYPDPAAEARIPALVSPPGSGTPSSTVTQVGLTPKVAKRSKSQGVHPRSTRSLFHGSLAGPDSLRSSSSLDQCQPSDTPVALSDLGVDRDGFLVSMTPGPGSATERTETSLDEGRALISPSLPTSPMKYLDLIHSAGVNAATKARGRRRVQVEFSLPEKGSQEDRHSAPHTIRMMSINCGSESARCSHTGLVSGEVDQKRPPFHNSPTSSMRSSRRSLSSVEDRDEKCPYPDDHHSSPEPSQTEEITDCRELEDELQGVKLMMGSRAVSPKYPIQHFQYQQLHPQSQQALLPPLPLSPLFPSAEYQNPPRAPRGSSLGHILDFHQDQSIPRGQISTDKDFGAEIGAAI